MRIEKLTELIGCKPTWVHFNSSNYFINNIELDSVIVFIAIELEFNITPDDGNIIVIFYTQEGYIKSHYLAQYYYTPDVLEFCKSQGIPYKII